MKKFIKALHIVPSWWVLGVDVVCVLVASVISVILRDNFAIFSQTHFQLFDYLFFPIVIVGVQIIFFFVFKSYKIVVRYTNTKDIALIFLSCFSAALCLEVINIFSYFINQTFLIPHSILTMEFFITLVLMLFYRISFKILYLETVNPAKFRRDIVIIGAGEAGITTKRALDRDAQSKYKVSAFFDNDKTKIGKQVENVQVIDYQKLSSYLKDNNISFLIIAIQNFSPEKTNEVTEIALQYNVKVLVVPPVKKWINGELSFKQIKKVKIEDLLERGEIVLDKDLINKDLNGKTIMITGAAGSIGSEIVRQVLNYNYKKLILVDNAETPVFYLRNECFSTNGLKDIEIEIASVFDKIQMEEIISRNKPSIIYHAAAYKHVPLMEENVGASIKTNVEGTKCLADLAVQCGVQKFVMVSTDKAVNPTNVMGASKRIAEIYVQSLNAHQNTTKFITTRFGNVLGTNGSVIPVFKKQIENGGPVMVTDPDITRFFMTIPEACQLVINAGAMGNGGEIFIFDMGKSVKIYDLAVKMIKLSGLTLGKDIQIKFSGLRPGEKLYEELLANKENTIETPNAKIMIAKVRSYSYMEISEQINELIAMKNDDEFAIVKKMKDIVPEYASKNSKFETLNH
ncbi:MAG TPA: nucleoside-diphosphate sugar epimerase/dehydratase [Bacteroidales bacterium]|nr:nucleoside-diphosphate sugar epimerase/dehydratase [Bacteroidales bacterium]